MFTQLSGPLMYCLLQMAQIDDSMMINNKTNLQFHCLRNGSFSDIATVSSQVKVVGYVV